jgi:hypothetical protein
MHRLLFFAFLCALLTACGNARDVAPADPNVSGTQSLTQVLAELNALPLPAGAAEADWVQLKQALATALQSSGKKKFVAAVAPPNKSTVADLAVSGDTTSATFTWTYKNTADYDQNGEVNVSDLTPMGPNLGKTPAAPDWDKARMADGDNNGEVNISDITPIGANFKNSVNGYRLQHSPDGTDGTWVMLEEIATSAGEAPGTGGPKTFAHVLAGASEGYYRVTVYAGEETGASSNVVQLIAADPTPGAWSGPGGGPTNSNSSPATGPGAITNTQRLSLGERIGEPRLGSDGNSYCPGLDPYCYKVSPDGEVLYSCFLGSRPWSYALAGDNSAWIGTLDNQLVRVSPQGVPQFTTALSYRINDISINSVGQLICDCDDHKVRALSPQDAGELWVFEQVDRRARAAVVDSTDDVYLLAQDANGDNPELVRLHSDGSFDWSIPDIGGPALLLPEDHVLVRTGDEFRSIAPDGSENWFYLSPHEIYGGSYTLSHDGAVIYLGEYTGVVDSVWMIDTATGVELGGIESPGDVIYGLVAGPDGRIWWGDSLGGLRSYKAGAGKWLNPLIFSARGFGDLAGNLVTSNNGELTKLDATGSVSWEIGIGNPTSESLAIAADGTIYLNVGGVLALRGDLTRKWFAEVEAAYSGGPVIGPDGTIYLAYGHTDVDAQVNSGGIKAFSPAGTELWDWMTVDGIPCAPAIGSNGQLYTRLIQWGGTITAVGVSSAGALLWDESRPNNTGFSNACEAVAVLPGTPDRMLCAINDALLCLDGDGNVVFEFPVPTGVTAWNVAFGLDGTAYGTWDPSDGSILLSIDPTGAENWRIEHTEHIHQLAVAADGSLRVDVWDGARDGINHVDVDGNWGWNQPNTGFLNGLLVDAAGKTYTKSSSTVYCYDLAGALVFSADLPAGATSAPMALNDAGELLVVLNTGEMYKVIP